jgi:hypothetical protein
VLFGTYRTPNHRWNNPAQTGHRTLLHPPLPLYDAIFHHIFPISPYLPPFSLGRQILFG